MIRPKNEEQLIENYTKYRKEEFSDWPETWGSLSMDQKLEYAQYYMAIHIIDELDKIIKMSAEKSVQAIFIELCHALSRKIRFWKVRTNCN